jgi:hypothetical protein
MWVDDGGTVTCGETPAMRRIVPARIERDAADGVEEPVAMMLCDRHADASVADESKNDTREVALTQLSCMWSEEGQTLSCGATPATVNCIELPSGSNGGPGRYPPLALALCPDHAERFKALARRA